MMTRPKTKAFTLVEILLVLVLISCGLLPIYSLLRSGQQRIGRADSRTIATLIGASALELARTLGYDRVKYNNKLAKDDDFRILQQIADKNGYILDPPIIDNSRHIKLPGEDKYVDFVIVKIIVRSKHEKSISKDVPDLAFVTILTDPRFNSY